MEYDIGPFEGSSLSNTSAGIYLGTPPMEASASKVTSADSLQRQIEEEEMLEVDRYIESMSNNNGSASLKRRALSSSFGESGDRKRLKEDRFGRVGITESGLQLMGDGFGKGIDGEALAASLAQELECGCCSALVYKPVIVQPCQHFFCGSCCVLWIRNGGTSCPSCRAVSSSVTPSRTLESMVNILLRADPSRVRVAKEMAQADELYRSGTALRIPMPREPSPEPTLPRNSDYAQPCPHCLPGNPFGWRCPQPITDPEMNRDNAWLLEDGAPPGHGYCGNCENLLALRAPSTTRCDFCQVSFCGVNVPQRCLAAPLRSQHPHGLSDVGDLIQSAEVYDCFDGNTVEVDIMLDYLTEHRLSPREIYRDIVEHVQKTPRQFTPLFDIELFTDVHPVVGGIDPNPAAPRQRICRVCAAEVLLWGLKEWWIRERKKGLLGANVLKRKDCHNGSGCGRQKDQDHAKEFNHIFDLPDTSNPTNPAENSSLQATNDELLPENQEIHVAPEGAPAVQGLTDDPTP